MAPSAADELALQRDEMNSSKVYTCSAGQVLLCGSVSQIFGENTSGLPRTPDGSESYSTARSCAQPHVNGVWRAGYIEPDMSHSSFWRHKPPELTSTIDFLNRPSHEHRFLLIFDSDPGIPGTPRESMEMTARYILTLRKTSYLLALRTSRVRFVPVTCNAAHGTRIGLDTLIREPGPSTY
ncbi:hypothetical protein SCUP234_08411 [Seiridium cupressi]